MRGSNLAKTHPDFSSVNDENETAAASPSFNVGTKYQARKSSTTPNNEAMQNLYAKRDALREFERQGYDIFWQSIGKFVPNPVSFFADSVLL
jgi:hypothetical protein